MSHKNVVAPEVSSVHSERQDNHPSVTSSIEPWCNWESALVEIRPGRYLAVCLHHLQKCLTQKPIDNSIKTRNGHVQNGIIKIGRKDCRKNINNVEASEDSETGGRANTASGVRISVLNEKSVAVVTTSTQSYQPSLKNIPDDVGGLKRRPDSTTTAFLMHGVGGSVQTWQFQIAMLRDLDLNIVNFDLLGHGASGSPLESRAYVFNELAADVLAVFDKYSTANNYIIAHSYGCRFAVYVAHERPLLASKLILISGGSPLPLLPPRGPFILPAFILQCFHTAISNAFISRSYHGRVREGVTRDSIFYVSTFVLKSTVRGQYWPEGDESYHREINTQTLIIHGINDQLVPIREAQLMNMTIPRSRLVAIDNAGHMVAMETPHNVNDIIKEFLTTIEN